MFQSKKVKKRNLSTPFIMTLLILTILIFLNLQTLTYEFNTDKYYAVQTSSTKEKTDGFTMLVPMVEYTYNFHGHRYKDSKYFVIQPLFGLSNKTGTVLDIYVNKKVPDRTLLKEPFQANILNWILVFLGLFFIYIFIRRIVGNVKVRKAKKLEERMETANDGE